MFTVWDLLRILDIIVALTKTYNLHLQFTLSPTPPTVTVVMQGQAFTAAIFMPECQPALFINFTKSVSREISPISRSNTLEISEGTSQKGLRWTLEQRSNANEDDIQMKGSPF